jgi:hypothetical protein
MPPLACSAHAVQVPGANYQVGAGIYDESIDATQLSQLFK